MADKAHDLVAALRFHKHPLTQQAADRIAELEAALRNALEACRHYRDAGTMDGIALAKQYEADARKAID